MGTWWQICRVNYAGAGDRVDAVLGLDAPAKCLA